MLNWLKRFASREDPWAVDPSEQIQSSAPQTNWDDAPKQLKEIPDYQFKKELRGEDFFADMALQGQEMRRLNNDPNYRHLDADELGLRVRNFQKRLGLYGEQMGPYERKSEWWKRIHERVWENQHQIEMSMGTLRGPMYQTPCSPNCPAGLCKSAEQGSSDSAQRDAELGAELMSRIQPARSPKKTQSVDDLLKEMQGLDDE